MNRILLDQRYIRNLYVQPAANDSGSSLGAAAYAAAKAGDTIAPMTHAYYGPQYTNEEIEQELKLSGYSYTKEADICIRAAGLLANAKVVGWFQGRMEWGPRALGNRSILGNPTVPGTADRINEIIKFREKWRPFCPAILKEHCSRVYGSSHPAPFMTIAFKALPGWKERIPEVVHVDGTMRPQAVDKETNPKFHRLIEHFLSLSGVPVVINTSLNRRGEPMICSPKDALLMFRESGLDYLAIGDFLVTKKREG
jgi:carbamoyltransferase